MITVNAKNLDFSELNARLRKRSGEITIINLEGQRFIAAGMSGKNIEILGVPGNALGAYLGDSRIVVAGNAQDAVGDTMNAGEIIVCGDIGDAAGYAMRGGEIYVRDNAGYRAGIHIKEYKDKKPAIVIGGRAGSFLGEYQAGGLIVVLGLHTDGKPTVGDFPCTGMHGGKIVVRGNVSDIRFPEQTHVNPATAEDLNEFAPYVKKFCELFGKNESEILGGDFTVITPNGKNPYKQMYVMN